MTHFFETCRPYMIQLQSRFFSQAVDEGIEFLRQTKQFARSAYETTPKGTPFYLLAIAAFHSHDFQTATFLFDAALSEDLTHSPENTNTPALLTMRLDDQDEKQAAFDIVKVVVRQIEAAISSYNARRGNQTLTIGDVRNHFLGRVLLAVDNPHLRTLTTAFISYFFEWDYRVRLIELSETGSREPFFMHLFRGCLLFESLLKENPKKSPTQKTLGRILNSELYAELNIPAALTISSPRFDTIVRSLSACQPMDAAIQCTGKARNTLGHNLAWEVVSLGAAEYNLLAENIAVSCLHAISCLYRVS
jgi:hypothetical protein